MENDNFNNQVCQEDPEISRRDSGLSRQDWEIWFSTMGSDLWKIKWAWSYLTQLRQFNKPLSSHLTKGKKKNPTKQKKYTSANNRGQY